MAGRSVLPQSPQAHIIIGLDLLRLLVENRIAEFHTELELLSPEVLPLCLQAPSITSVRLIMYHC